MRPLPPGQSIRASHIKNQKRTTMPSPEVYNDYYGIGLRLVGKSTLVTFDNIYHITPCCLVFINKNLYHRALYTEEQTISGTRIHFNEEVAEKLISIIGNEEFNMLFEQVTININEEATTKLEQLFDMLVAESGSPGRYSAPLLENMLSQLFIMVLRAKDEYVATPTIPNTHNTAILEAIHYIEQNFAHDPSLAEVADHLNISTSHLSRLFTSQTGTSYSEFLLRHKVNHAQKLLINDNISITEVADLSGFSSINYFCCVFKKIMGIPPLQYRKNNR